jgi:quercetin dioxygenase-like cupin family protein
MKSAVFAAALALVLTVPAVARAPESVRLGQFDTTNTGQAILLPKGPAQVTVSRVTLAVGDSLPVHKHPYSRYGYIEAGTIRVSNLDTGKVTDYHAGDTIIEARGQWHTGQVLGASPVVILVIDQTPPGKGNVIVQSPPG